VFHKTKPDLPSEESLLALQVKNPLSTKILHKLNMTVSEFGRHDCTSRYHQHRKRIDRQFCGRHRGWSVAMACLLEASAFKPGNVSPWSDFEDLSYEELIAAGIAVAEVFDRAPSLSLGHMVLDAVTASRAVTRSNANLGIVLAVAPLAKVPDGTSLRVGVSLVLSSLTASDASTLWVAINKAKPGGLAKASQMDLADPAPVSILDAMRAAADRDQIASLWSRDYDELFSGPVADLCTEWHDEAALLDNIVIAYLKQLSRRQDTQILRRHGVSIAADIMQHSRGVLAASKAQYNEKLLEMDRLLRTHHTRINPGSTADLIAAALFFLLYERLLVLPQSDHP